MTIFNPLNVWLVLAYLFCTSANAASWQQALDRAWSAQQNKWRSEAESHLANIDLSKSWTPEPPKLEVSHTTDQVDTNHGRREWEVGVDIPLWLPGQRDNSIHAAVVEQHAFEGRRAFEKWKLAGELREAWWAARFSEVDVANATHKLRLLERLTADVVKKLKAGEVAPLEAHQAKLVELDARRELALANAAHDQAIQAFQLISFGAELPERAEELRQNNMEHPALANAALESGAASAQLKKTSNSALGTPELGLSYTSERDAFDESYSGTVKVGITIPWGAGAESRAQMAVINASLSRAQMDQEQTIRAIMMQQRLAANELQQARTNADIAAMQMTLAQEKSAWVKKGYQKGQFDLAIYLKTLQEEWQSQSLLTRSRLEIARAISRSNQAAGVY